MVFKYLNFGFSIHSFLKMEFLRSIFYSGVKLEENPPIEPQVQIQLVEPEVPSEVELEPQEPKVPVDLEAEMEAKLEPVNEDDHFYLYVLLYLLVLFILMIIG